ncbi:MAG: sulfotransferase [Bradymonadaceae bacterium]
MHETPIIITGMHRSGTSLLTRMLEHLGLFVGARTETHREATFFLDLNRWLLQQAGGRWDYPDPIDDLLDHKPARRRSIEYLRAHCDSLRRIEYVGLDRFLDETPAWTFDGPWGWKDPRNTYTLPIWLELFPEARVLYIERNGIDVADSLYRRNESSSAKWRMLHDTIHDSLLEPIYWFWRRGDHGFETSQRCARRTACLGLWRQYVDRGRSHVAALGDRAAAVEYEELLRAPAKHLPRLAEFCGLAVDDDQLYELAKMVDPSRVEAWRDDDNLRQFARRNRDVLAEFGYSA